MALEEVRPSLSPSMDIQVPSNFERLLFQLLDGEGTAVAATLKSFRETGRFSLPPEKMAMLRQDFAGVRLDDVGTLAEMALWHRRAGLLLDPHSAVALAAARTQRDRAVPMVALASAHPAKFPEAVERATGFRPTLPPALSDLRARPERYEVLPKDLSRLKAFVTARARLSEGVVRAKSRSRACPTA
jgi:threonine synthase